MCNRGAFVLRVFLDLVSLRSYDQDRRIAIAVQHMRHVQLFVAALLVAAPVAMFAQTQPRLADVARAEEARRKALPKAAKVYTNEDLRPDISTGLVSSNASPAAPAPSTQVPSLNLPGGKPEPLPPEKDPAYWSARISAARAALERSKVFLDALQSRINALTADFTARDDPAQRAQLERERQRAIAELERVKQEIAEQTKAISDIEEEARKAGVPPGWLR